MGASSLRSVAAVPSFPLLLFLSQLWTSPVHGRSIEVVQSRRKFDLAHGQFGEVIDSITSRFLDTDPDWTKKSCLNLPVADKEWSVDWIGYNPSNVNPEFRWFLKSIVIFSGFDCKTTYHGAPPPPVRIDIENLDEIASVPAWLQARNYPYFGITYDPVVDPGTVTIQDPEQLLGRPMTAQEKAEAQWEKEQGYLETLRAQALRQREASFREILSESEEEILEMEALREFSKLETTRYDIWPQYQFFGQASIRLEWDMEVFHVNSEEEWTNRFDLGEEIVPITGGDVVDENSD
ncbi:hypothetical protein TWF481_001172 [Arthrobotrys musiformis]|uniref:Uncharacterized protein n=1 Tax=Arthrobotrys musiformis TaxID=47236 RepID=A0AAV9WQW0_9PEZI